MTFNDDRVCGLDGCEERVTITLRPDSRYRVTHGSDSERGTTFLTHSELFVTTGFWPFCRSLHDEDGRPHSEKSMARQAVERLAS